MAKITHKLPKIPLNDPQMPQKWPKMVKNDKNWQKNGQNYPHMAKNSTKQPKMPQKWFEMLRQLLQIRPGILTPNCLTKNDEILTKNGKIGKKMPQMTIKLARNGQKWPKMV